MQAGGPLHEDQGGIAAVCQVAGREQAAAGQPGMDAGQGRGVVACGGHDGHVGDDVGGVVVAGLGHLGEVAGPAGDLAPAGVPGRRVVGRDDPQGRRRLAGIAVIISPAQPSRWVPVVVLHQDLPQCLRPRAAQQHRVAGGQVLQQPAGVRPRIVQPDLPPGGVLAQADLAAVAAAPFLTDEAVQHLRSGAGELLQGGADRLGDQLQPGQAPHGGQHVGGVGALGGALADQPGLLEPGQGQVQKLVCPPVFLQQPVAEVAEHAVAEAGIVELEAERVLEGRSGTAPPRRHHGRTGPAGTAARSPSPAGPARSPGARPADTTRRSPRHPTGRRAGPAPTSPSSRPGWRPAPPARSAPGPRPPGGDGSTSRTPQGSRRTHVPARLAPGVTAVSQIPRFPTESTASLRSELDGRHPESVLALGQDAAALGL